MEEGTGSGMRTDRVFRFKEQVLWLEVTMGNINAVNIHYNSSNLYKGKPRSEVWEQREAKGGAKYLANDP